MTETLPVPPGTRVTYRKRDLSTALDCAKKAGIPVARIEIEADGKIVVIAGNPEACSQAKTNAFDGADL